MQSLSLEHITAMGASPIELLQIAQVLGCSAISLIPAPSSLASMPIQNVYGDEALQKDILTAMEVTGVRIHTLDALLVGQSVPGDHVERILDLAARLNVDKCTLLPLDSDPELRAEQVARTYERAALRGIRLALEFVPALSVKTVQDAREVLRRAGSPPNALILVDALHLQRSGGTPADVQSVPRTLIESAQICDGPLEMPPEGLWNEAAFERRVPGDGTFPLVELLSSLPPDTLIGVEVPREQARLAGVSALERSRAAVEGARRIISAAQRHRGEVGLGPR
jgi:sugar phosphate isomerase/epimerase